MLVSLKNILADAYERHYATGAFNLLSIEHAKGAIAAAEELRSPIIMQVAEVQFPYAPLEIMAPIFLDLAKKATVPVAVHLDHGQSLETCVKALMLGYNSVMFDGACLPFEENVAITAAVAKIAKAAGADIEAELGKVGETSFGTGKEDEIPDVFTDVEESAKFVEMTGIDALAIAIGNLHGRYTATPRLNITRLKELSARNRLPLVLHGGSGTSEDDFKSCIRNGISKINVATALQTAVTDEVKKYLAEVALPNYIDMKRVITEATKKSVMEHMILFESADKA